MSEDQMGTSIQIAQKLVGRLPEKADDELKDLVRRAEEGADVSIEIIDLLSSHDNIRRWMKHQITLEKTTRNGTRGFSPLAGKPVSIPASQLWVCPKEICEESLPVIQEGEDAPMCEVHEVEMILRSEKTG
jgi:hypothetical protein